MSIDDAIVLADDVADKNEEKLHEANEAIIENLRTIHVFKYRQLANWLRELKRYKEAWNILEDFVEEQKGNNLVSDVDARTIYTQLAEFLNRISPEKDWDEELDFVQTHKKIPVTLQIEQND